jgi:hypothetical protein
MQGANLSWHNAYDQPFLANFKENNTFPWPKHNSADYFYATLTKASATGKFFCKPSCTNQ